MNTLDEVPDSSWFTNRIGVRDLPMRRSSGGQQFERLDATDWVVARGKSPGGFHPGFVAEHPGDPGQFISSKSTRSITRSWPLAPS